MTTPNYLQPLSNDRRKVRVTDPRRAFRGLKNEPVGLVYGNTMRVDPGLQNVLRSNVTAPSDQGRIRSTAPWSAHTTTGEDASRPTSEHWAITHESVDPIRLATEAILSGSHPLGTDHPAFQTSYRNARNYVIAQQLRDQLTAVKRSQRQQTVKAHRLATKLMGPVK